MAGRARFPGDSAGTEVSGPRETSGSYIGAADLDEILAALELPRAALGQWFADLQRFCESHGGARYYGQLMALLDACEERLAASELPARS